MLATTYMKTHYGKMHVDRFFYHDNSEGDDFEICGLLSVPYTGYFLCLLQCIQMISVKCATIYAITVTFKIGIKSVFL